MDKRETNTEYLPLQRFPLKVWGQTQRKSVLPTILHIPPLWHGLESQGSCEKNIRNNKTQG